MSTYSHSPPDQMFQIPPQSCRSASVSWAKVTWLSFVTEKWNEFCHCIRKLGYRLHLPFRWQKGSVRHAGYADLEACTEALFFPCHVSAIQPAFILNRTEDDGSPLLSFVFTFESMLVHGFISEFAFSCLQFAELSVYRHFQT
jgi:hypothetical protein